MRAKHTQGPWSIILPSGGKSSAKIDAPQWGKLAKVIVRMRGFEMYNEEGLANARLIAAAPELLREMLRYLPIFESLEKNHPIWWDFLTQGTGIATLNGYRNVIAKATGEGEYQP